MQIDDNCTIGSLIRNLRLEQNVAQYQLGLGLCSPATMNRFESGERDMDMLMAIRVFQRLGYTPDKFELYGSSEEFVQYDQRLSIDKWMRLGKVDAVKKELQEYQKKWKEWIDAEQLQQQYVNGVKGYLKIQEGKIEKGIALLEEAIEMTIPEYKKDWDETAIAGEYELALISQLADADELAERKQEAYEIRVKIIHYIQQKGMRRDQIVELYTALVCKIAPVLLEREELKQCLELCDRGFESLSTKRRLYNWPDLLFWRAKCLEYFYGKGALEKQQVIEAFKKAYYIYDLFENKEMADKVWNHLKEEYEWESIR